MSLTDFGTGQSRIHLTFDVSASIPDAEMCQWPRKSISLQNKGACKRIREDARACERIQEDARACERIQEDARVCERIQEHARGHKRVQEGSDTAIVAISTKNERKKRKYLQGGYVRGCERMQEDVRVREGAKWCTWVRR